MRTSIFQLHDKWTQWDQAYSHGYLLVLVCCLFIVRGLSTSIYRSKLRFFYPFLVIVPSLVWVFGYSTQTGAFEQLALPAFFACYILPFTGIRRAARFVFPFALLYLAIPVWEVLTPALQNVTTQVSTFGVRLLEVPAYIDGYSFSLPHGTVVVAGSCAGLSYFLMAIVLSSINSLYHRFQFVHAVGTILLMAALAIIGNWIRVYSLIIIAYYTNMQSSLVYEHGMYGWWIFAGLFLLYLWLIRKIPSGAASEHAPSVKLPGIIESLILVGLTSVLALLLPVWIQSGKLQADYDHASLEIPGFENVTPGYANSKFPVHYAGFDIEEYLQSTVSGRKWLVGRKTYIHQSQGKELISALNYVSANAEQSAPYSFDSGTSLNVSVIEGRKDKLILSSFIIGERLETDEWEGKIAQFTELLAGRSTNAYWYAALECESYRCNAELENLDELLPPLEAWLLQSALY